ncbi:ammonium transporter, partial [bacterium]|nr:ammonium transporter [bacterium]
NFVFVFLVSYLFFKLLDKLVGLRVDPISEIEGLDIPEMGVPGYMGIKVTKEEVLPEVISLDNLTLNEREVAR